MGETPREIEQHIHVKRAELDDNLNELEHRFRDATNWRTYVERKPLTMVGVALGSGILLAALIGRRRGPSRRYVSAEGSDFSSQRPRREQQRNPGGDKFGKIAGALAGVAADRALRFLSDLVPGFRQNYEGTGRRTAARNEREEAGSIH